MRMYRWLLITIFSPTLLILITGNILFINRYNYCILEINFIYIYIRIIHISFYLKDSSVWIYIML